MDSIFEDYRKDIAKLTHEYLDKIISDLYEKYGFTSLFVHNEYEVEGISFTQLAFSRKDEIVVVGKALEIYDSVIIDNSNILLNADEKELICITLEEIMFYSYGFDWIITASELEDGKINYMIHNLESTKIEF